MITFKWFNKSGGTQLFNIKDGVTYIDNFNEELDSATVVLMWQSKLNFEPFDIVELALPIGTKTMIINDFVENKLDIDDDNSYQYTINLMSKTKELERVTLPNISYTKDKTEGAYHWKVWNLCNMLINDYSPKLIYSGAFDKKYSNALSDNILNTECPDLQMSKPTLRSALDRTLSVVNGISILNGNNQVNWLNLNKRGNPINITEEYNYQPENQSSNDYASETENNYNNVVPNYINNIKNDTISADLIGFRTESMIVSDNNAELIVNNPIYDLKELRWCGSIRLNYEPIVNIHAVVNYDGTNYDCTVDFDTIYYEIDIIDYVVEEQDYNILDYETKKSRAYYSRGGNKIQGLLNYKKSPFQIEDYITLKRIISNIMYNNGFQLFYGEMKDTIVNNLITHLPSGTVYDESLIRSISIQNAGGNKLADASFSLDSDDSLRKKSMFKIKYESQNENIRMKSGKYLRETHQDNIIIDNPGEAFVDIKRQGELFNQKCNRLGNRVKDINARFSDTSNIPELSDYLDDKVLIRREFQFYDDYILFRGVLTENYVNINYFTGINARKRTWNLVSAGEAFDKELLDKWYCEFNFTYIDEIAGTASFVKQYLANDLLQVFVYNNNPIASYAVLGNQWTDSGDQYVNWVDLDLTTYISGNSLIFNCKTEDNYSTGINITDPDGTGGMIEQYVKYVHPNGTAENFTISLFNQNLRTGYQFYNKLEPGTRIVGDTSNLFSAYIDLSYMKPRRNFAYLQGALNDIGIYQYQFVNHKDSREKLGFNIQFEFCSATPDIIIGEAFMERQQLVNTANRNDTLVIWWSTQKYKITEKYLRTTNSYQCSGNISIAARNNLVSTMDLNISSDLSQENVQSFAICDSNNRLILAVNTTNKTGFKIYLNMLRTRDRRNYVGTDLKNWN